MWSAMEGQDTQQEWNRWGCFGQLWCAIAKAVLVFELEHCFPLDNLALIVLNLGFRVWLGLTYFQTLCISGPGCSLSLLRTGVVNSELKLKWHLRFGNLTWDSRRNAHIQSKTGISCLCGSMLKILKVREASTWGWLAQWLVVFVDHNLVINCSVLSKHVLGFEILEASSGLAFWPSWRFRSPEGATAVGFLGLSGLGVPRMQDPNSWFECFRCSPFVFFQTQELENSRSGVY